MTETIEMTAEEIALRNSKYCFGTGKSITCVKMRNGVGDDGFYLYTIENYQVVMLAHSRKTVAGVLISRHSREASPTSSREFYLFAFLKNRSYFDLLGASYLGRYERADLNVLYDGEVRAEGLDQSGNIDQEIVLNANFFRIRIE
jgi:hypothetical protein